MATLARRTLLAGGSAAAVAAAAGAGSLLLRRDSNPGRAGLEPSPTSGVPSPAVSPPRRGGLARVHAPASFNFDTFDALRTGEPSVLEVLGRTHSRLVDWVDPAGAILGPALARSWEQPEPGRLVLHLDAAARWQPTGALETAPVTPADARSFLRRAVDLARASRQPAVQRAHDWLRLTKVTDTGGTLVLESHPPDPFLLHTLASRFALVQRPGAIEAFESTWHEQHPESAAGSGPLVFEGISVGALQFRAVTGGASLPNLDRLEVGQPADVPGRFRAGRLDEAILRDRRDAPALLAEFPGLEQLTRFEESPIISTVFAGAPPWDNSDLRLALSGALNRGELSRRLFDGRASPSGPVPPAHAAFALPESELAAFPGYRLDPAADFADARRRWDAAGGPALGPITIDIPAIFDPPYSASSVIGGMLHEALGAEVIVRVDRYPVISARATAREYGDGRLALWFGWGPPLLEPEPARHLIETYGSTSPGFAVTGYHDAGLDSAVERLAVQHSLNERKENVKHIQLLLLAGGGGGLFSWLLQSAEVLRRPFYDAPAPSPFWQQHLAVHASVDPADPAYTATGR